MASALKSADPTPMLVSVSPESNVSLEREGTYEFHIASKVDCGGQRKGAGLDIEG